MKYLEIRNLLSNIANTNHKDYVKAIISIEMNIKDEELLNKMYDKYMSIDNINLISDDFKMYL